MAREPTAGVGAVGAQSPAPIQETELGPLPEEWRVVRLGEVVGKTQQVDPRKLPEWHFKYIDVSCIDNERLRIIGWQECQGNNAPSRARKVIQHNDVIFATVRPYLKRAALVSLDFDKQVCSTAFCVLRAKPHLILPDFLFFAVTRDSFVNAVSEHQRGSSYPAVTDSDVLREYIPLPPLPEQRAIAHVLRAVQQAQEATERVIQAAQELKKSLMRHLFTYGPVPVVGAQSPAPLQETELGPIPQHWPVVRLGEVVEKTQLVDPRKLPEWHFKYIDVSCIDNERLRIIGWQECQGNNAPSRARKVIQYNDVIFATVRPYLKRAALVSSDFDKQVCSTAFCVLRAKPHLILPDFLFFAVTRDSFVNAVSEHQRGSSYPAVTDSDVLREYIPLPPLPEQQEIARILQAVDRKIEAEQARKRALEALFQSLLHHLMTAKVRLPAEFIARFAQEVP